MTTCVSATCLTLWLCASVFAQNETTRPAFEPFYLTPPPESQPAGGPFKTAMEKASYSVGLDIARNIKRQIPDVNLDLLIRGIRDGMADQPLLNEWEWQDAVRSYQRQALARQREREANPAKINKEEGEAFLTRNAELPGVKTTGSGLQYKVIKEGDGPTPRKADTVRVRYRGTLVDGTEFDSSGARTVEFPVAGVIKGWTEALQMMKVGSKWELFIPSNLAYGEQQAGPQIGPNSTLIFEVELVGIKSAQPADTGRDPRK